MTYDTGINFDFIKFHTRAKILSIIYYLILVKAHWSIKKVEKYSKFICQVYNIIQVGTKDIISKNTMLQMVFKAVNDTASLDGLVSTLLVFSIFPRIVINSPTSASQQ